MESMASGFMPCKPGVPSQKASRAASNAAADCQHVTNLNLPAAMLQTLCTRRHAKVQHVLATTSLADDTGLASQACL